MSSVAAKQVLGFAELQHLRQSIEFYPTMKMYLIARTKIQFQIKEKSFRNYRDKEQRKREKTMDFFLGVKQFPLSCAGFASFVGPRIPALPPSAFFPILPSFSSTLLRFQGNIIQVQGKPRCAASKISCSANSVGVTEENVVVKERSVSVILLAGGKGKRMAASMPKQYLPLIGQPIALYSLYTFSQMIEVKEIVVVCDPSYRDIFEDTKEKINVVLKFSEPGKERQDSVYSGLQAVDPTSELVCIHDSARPLVLSQDVKKVLKDGWLHGAAVLGVPVKATIKEASGDQFVVRTLDRKTLWEMQTPQVIRPALLKEGFDLVNREGLEVTDDVSIVEHLKHPVYITEGSYTNIKITTPDDLLVAERILNSS